MKEGEIMKKNFNEIFSNRLKYYMELNNMSQKELAEKVNVSEASVAYWTSGAKVPRADKVDKICEILHCNRSDLVDEPDSPDSLLKRHLKNYAQLPDDQKKMVDELITVLQVEPENTYKIMAMLQTVLSFFDS